MDDGNRGPVNREISFLKWISVDFISNKKIMCAWDDIPKRWCYGSTRAIWMIDDLQNLWNWHLLFGWEYLVWLLRHEFCIEKPWKTGADRVACCRWMDIV